ncbi:MAG: hypothetical protein C7B47_10730 [Sulfobacillus thermosulfidooxidans]|uniref:Transcriptional regulator n=1 Tax=Sulfobacillus thermosulfidooxidans TaxID=28034 RepID=A0A2T2WVW3_SULTH|nr:MAG: hypothetical protein C7B47_10730 [Sulfobacillus thermosulfidooxidans]
MTIMIVNRLLFIIVQSPDAQAVAKALTQNHIRFTQITSRGAFLNLGNTTFMIGTDHAMIPSILSIIEQHSQEREILAQRGYTTLHPDIYAYPTTVLVGGAIVFSLPVERYIHLI